MKSSTCDRRTETQAVADIVRQLVPRYHSVARVVKWYDISEMEWVRSEVNNSQIAGRVTLLTPAIPRTSRRWRASACRATRRRSWSRCSATRGPASADCWCLPACTPRNDLYVHTQSSSRWARLSVCLRAYLRNCTSLADQRQRTVDVSPLVHHVMTSTCTHSSAMSASVCLSVCEHIWNFLPLSLRSYLYQSWHLSSSSQDSRLPAGLPLHLTPLLLRLRFGICWPLCAFINYIYLLTC